MNMKMRVGLTVATFIIWGWAAFFLGIVAPVVTGSVAGQQFENSNSAYVFAQYGMRLFSLTGFLLTISMVGVLLVLWWTPAKLMSQDDRVRGAAKRMLPLVALAVLFWPVQSFAYYDTSDYNESYFILPNESAFFIPDIGANKDSQAKFGSQEYLEENKIAAKRFTIPHVKLTNSGLFSNYYVPSGRLIIVDRTPYNKEWTAALGRGTAAKDEAFPCQSAEGLNITLEMAVAASVSEDNASKFLYRFGVNAPQGDRSQPAVIFTSVFSGKSLGQVMDTVGRGETQTLACAEISTHTLDDANAKMSDILKAIQTKAQAWFKDYGITIDYLGWAGTFTFDETVQKAINDRYSAEKIAPVLATIQAQADVKIKEGLGKGLADHGLPQSFVAIPTNLLDSFSALFKPSAK